MVEIFEIYNNKALPTNTGLSSHEIIAIVVSVLALTLTLFQAWATRRHNYLSVRPLLRAGWKASNEFHGVSLKNLGLGPAIVKKYEILQNRQKITTSKLQKMIDDIGIKNKANFIESGSIIDSTKTGWVIRSSGPIQDPKIRAKFWALLQELTIEVEYKSFYNRSQPSISYRVPNPLSEGLIFMPGDTEENSDLKDG